MHKNIDEIKKLESSPQIIKNLFNKNEIEKFFNLYKELPTTVHNKKQNVIKKRWLKNYSDELENLFFNKVKNEIGDFKMDNLKDEKNEDILGLFQESYNPIGLHVDAGCPPLPAPWQPSCHTPIFVLGVMVAPFGLKPALRQVSHAVA